METIEMYNDNIVEKKREESGVDGLKQLDFHTMFLLDNQFDRLRMSISQCRIFGITDSKIEDINVILRNIKYYQDIRKQIKVHIAQEVQETGK